MKKSPGKKGWYGGKGCVVKEAIDTGMKGRLSTGNVNPEPVAVKALAAVPPGQKWWSGMSRFTPKEKSAQ